MYKIVMPATDFKTMQLQADRVEGHIIVLGSDIVAIESPFSGKFSVAIHTDFPMRIMEALVEDGFLAA